MLFNEVKKDLILGSAESLLNIQKKFKQRFQVDDIFGNSKVFEIVIANRLGHILIPGHSGTRDCKDADGNIFEYKHYKESSSNHSWTFNDYSQTIFEKMRRENYKIIYAHMNDTNGLSRNVFKRERPKEIKFPELDWYYEIPGSLMANYLEKYKTPQVDKHEQPHSWLQCSYIYIQQLWHQFCIFLKDHNIVHSWEYVRNLLKGIKNGFKGTKSFIALFLNRLQ